MLRCHAGQCVGYAGTPTRRRGSARWRRFVHGGQAEEGRSRATVEVGGRWHGDAVALLRRLVRLRARRAPPALRQQARALVEPSQRCCAAGGVQHRLGAVAAATCPGAARRRLAACRCRRSEPSPLSRLRPWMRRSLAGAVVSPLRVPPLAGAKKIMVAFQIGCYVLLLTVAL